MPACPCWKRSSARCTRPRCSPPPSPAPSMPSGATARCAARPVSNPTSPASRRSSPCCATACWRPTSTRTPCASSSSSSMTSAPARIALDRYFADANHIGEDRAAALHLLTVSATWRRACQDALLAVRQLHADLIRLPAQYASNSKLLNNLLQDDHHRRLAVPRRRRPDRPSRSAAAPPVGAPHRMPAVHAHPQSGDVAGLRA